MARAKARTDRLSTVLSRKKPEEIETAVADLLENGRRQALGRMAAATTRELEILQRTLEEVGEDQARTARLAHLVAVAQGDRDLAEIAAVAITRIRKPTPNSLTLAGHVAIRGGKLPKNAALVFADKSGEEIDGAPIVKLAEDGEIATVLAPAEVKRLIAAIGDRGGVLLALKVGERIVATTSMPISIRPGKLIQVTLIADLPTGTVR
jgi:hypothetical protein